MSDFAHVARRLASLTLLAALSPLSLAQELQPSGVAGIDLVYASDPGGMSQLFVIAPALSATRIPIGAPIANVPSRWAHRRKTLGAEETRICWSDAGVLLTPMGSGVGTGAIHMIDGRVPGVGAMLVPTGNPAAYDLAIDESLHYAFSAEDDGFGGTTLRGFTFATPNTLTPLNPPTLSLPGAPSSYVNRIGVDEAADLLHVPTVDGLHVISLQAAAPQMTVTAAVSSAPFVPATNPATFLIGSTRKWIVGTCRFNANNAPVEAGWAAWDAAGSVGAGQYGSVPTAPAKNWISAAGTEELAVVSDGSRAYAYYLLREPPPSTFFIKPSAVGVTRFDNGTTATSTILCPDDCGEPFANPSVSGTRVAFESSLGEPFTSQPPGGAEKINILYSPLDPLGQATLDGLLTAPGPLGGRISTKGMDRPLWTRDGTRVVSATSHFPGAPNPGMPGLEVLNVYESVPMNPFIGPHVVVENPISPNQSILFPSRFQPRSPAQAAFLAPFSFVGNVFHDGMASVMTLPWGEIGQKQSGSYTQSTAVPNFPAILPPSFDYAAGASTPPGNFGARRTTFNLVQLQFGGLIMTGALDDRILVQPTGNNFLAKAGFGVKAAPIVFPLPTGWVTTTEFLSL